MKNDLLIENDESKSLDVLPEPALSKTLRKAKESLLQAFTSDRTHSTGKYFYLKCLCPVIRAWQLLSLVVPTESDMVDWTKYRGVTHSFYYVRLDGLAAALSQLPSFLMFILSLISVTLGLLLAQVVLSLQRKTYPALPVLFRYMLSGLDSFLYIGGFIAALSCVKYTMVDVSLEISDEYDDVRADTIRSGVLAATAIVALPALVAVKLMACLFTYENRYLKRKVAELAMPCAAVRTNEALTEVATCLFYVFLPAQEKWYLVVVAALHGRMAALHITQLPYYVHANNLVHALPSIMCSWTAVSYLLALELNNANVLFWLVFFVSPLLVALAYHVMIIVREKIQKGDVTKATGAVWVEIYLRKLYEDYEEALVSGKEAVEGRIHEVFNYATRNFRQVGMVFVWEADFYLSYCKDPSRALGKLSKLSTSTQSLEAFFHANKILSKIGKSDTEELAYFRSQHTFEKAKRADRHLCVSLMAFCGELLSYFGRMDKLELQAKRVHFLTSKCVSRYKTLCDAANVPKEALETYSQLLQTLINDPSSLNIVKHQRFREEKHLEREESIYSRKRGVVVVSFREENFGEIVHVNSFAFGKMGNKVTDVVGTHVGKFLPTKIAQKHDSIGYKTIIYGKNFANLPNLYRFLINKSNRLQQIVAKCRLIIWKMDLYLIIDFQLAKCESALLDESLKVLHASENFGVRCGALPSDAVEGLNITKLIPDIGPKLVSLSTEEKRQVAAGKTMVRLLLERVSYEKTTLLVISTVKKETDTSTYWESGLLEIRQTSEIPDSTVKPQKRVEFDEGKPETRSEIHQSVTRTDIRASASTVTATSSVVSPYVLKRNKSIGKLKSTAKLLKVAILVSMMTMAAFAIGILLVILGLIDTMENMNNVKSLTSQLVFAASIVDYARTLTVIADFPSLNQSTVSSQMQADVSAFASELNQLQGEMESWSGNPAQEYYLKTLVPTFEPQEKEFKMRWRTMLDASLHLVSEASAFLSQPPSLSSPHFRYLYRNALSETFSYLNRTNYLYVSGEEFQRRSNMGVVIYLIIVWVVLVALSFCGLLLTVRWKVDNCKLEVWEEFLACPIEVLQSIKQGAADRLSNIHGEETMENEIKRRKSAVKPLFSKIWPGIALRLSVYVALSGTVIYLLFFWQYGLLTDLLITMPHYTNYVVQRRAVSLGAYFWLREHFVEASGDAGGYFELVSSLVPIVSPGNQFVNFTKTARAISKVLFTERADFDIIYLHRSTSYDNFMFANACPELTFADCTTSGFFLGLRRAMDDYLRQMESLDASIAQKSWKDIEPMQILSRKIDEGLKYVEDFYFADTTQSLNQFRSLFAGVTSVYCLFLVVIALLCYIPYVTKARKDILNLWTVLSLFSFDERRVMERS